MRSIVCVPFALLLAVIGADRLARASGAWMPSRWTGTWRAVFLVVVACVFVVSDWNIYFRRMPASRDLWSWCEGPHLLAGQTLAAVPSGRDLYASQGYSGYNHEMVLTYGRPLGHLVPGQPLPPGIGRERPAALLVAMEQDAILGAAVRDAFPHAEVTDVSSPFGDVLFRLYGIRPAGSETP